MAAARKRQELAAQQERLREAYNELKYTAPDKVAAMRDQEMTRLQMNLAYRTGEELLRTDCDCIIPIVPVVSALWSAGKVVACQLIYLAHLCAQVTVRRPSSWRTG